MSRGLRFLYGMGVESKVTGEEVGRGRKVMDRETESKAVGYSMGGGWAGRGTEA